MLLFLLRHKGNVFDVVPPSIRDSKLKIKIHQ